MAEIRFFEADFSIPNDRGNPVTLPVIERLDRGALVLRDGAGTGGLVYVYRSAADAPFAGDASAGYTGDVAALTVYRGEIAEAARVYEVTGFRVPLALVLDPATGPFALDDAVFGGDDVVRSALGEIPEAALAVTTRDGDRDVAEGAPGQIDILALDRAADDVLTGTDGALTLLGARGTGETIARLREVESVRFADGSVATIADLADRGPVADDDALPADTPVEVGADRLIAAGDLLANDLGFALPNPGEAELTLVAVEDGSSLGSAVLEGGAVRYDATGPAFDTLADGETLIDSFTYRIEDALGRTASATVSLTVTGIDRDPVVDPASDLAGAVSELADGADGEGVATLSDSGALIFTDPDIAGAADLGAASARLVSGAPAGSLTPGPAEDLPGGGIRVGWEFAIPDAALEALATDDARELVYALDVPDAAGETVVSEAVRIALTPVNDAPEATDDSAATAPDAPVTIDVLANDADPDGGAGGADARAIARVAGETVSEGQSVTLPSGAVVSLSGGRLVYDPGTAFADLPPGESATDTFTYAATDGLDSREAGVTVTIAAGANTPVAIDAAGSTLTGAFGEDAVPARAEGTVAFTDPDANEDHTAALSNADPGFALGAVTAPDGATPGRVPWSFAPGAATLDPLFEGESRSFAATLTVTDAAGAADSAPLSVTVTGVNDAPVALGDSATVGAFDTVTIPVLANDTDIDGGPGGAPELDIVTVAGTPLGAGESVTLASGAVVTRTGGTLVYDTAFAFAFLTGGQTATDSFPYTAGDGLDSSAPATVEVTVTSTAPPPPALPVLSLAGQDRQVVEGDPGDIVDLVFRATLDRPAPADVTFTATAAPVGAAPASDGADFLGFTLPVTIPENAEFADISVQIAPDDLVEADETFTLTLGAVTGADLGDPDAIGTIVDDDRRGTLLRIDTAGLVSATPAAETFVIRVEESGGRISNPDFTGQAPIANFDPASDLLYFETVAGSAVTEADILAGTGIELVEDPIEDEFVLGFDPDPALGGVGAVVTVQGAGEPEADFVEAGGALPAGIPSAGGGALPPGLLDPIRFGPGDSVIAVDAVAGYLGGAGDDVFVLDPALLPGGDTAVVDQQGSNTIRLAPGLAIDSFEIGAFSGGGFAMVLDFGADGEVFVDNAEGFGYEVGGVPGGAPAAAIAFDDFVSLILGGVVPGPGGIVTGTPGVTIGGNLSILDATATEGDTGASPAILDIVLDGVVGQDVSAVVDLVPGGSATPGVDLIGGAQSVVIPAGLLSTSVAFDVQGDTLLEGNETQLIEISGPLAAGIADGVAVLTILDDEFAIDDTAIVSEDGPPVAIDATANDGPPGGPSPTVVGISGQAVLPGDTVVLDSGALASLDAGGSIVYDPNGLFEGLDDGQTDLDNFPYEVEDAAGNRDTGRIDVTIEGVTDLPPGTLIDGPGVIVATPGADTFIVRIDNTNGVPVFNPDYTGLANIELFDPVADTLVFENTAGSTVTEADFFGPGGVGDDVFDVVFEDPANNLVDILFGPAPGGGTASAQLVIQGVDQLDADGDGLLDFIDIF